ncbi:hypothetical protein BGZ51_001719 [Haplosporangium sp. Z 767]|nr:hypothetical protein BGZ51_001719 [Haplosporangium sp. Z 767]
MSVTKKEDLTLIQNNSKYRATGDNDSAQKTKMKAKCVSKRVPRTIAVSTMVVKKRKAIVSHDHNQADSHNQPIDTNQPGTKRRREVLEMRVPGVRIDPAINLANAMIISTIQKTNVNRTDPCAVSSIEIWHFILSYLPVFQVAKIFMVCRKNDYNAPKRKYKSHMAIVCANIQFICDRCYSHTDGKHYRSADIPLPVQVQRKTLSSSSTVIHASSQDASSQGLTNFNCMVMTDQWFLCLHYRLLHYQRHSEVVKRPMLNRAREDETVSRISRTRACAEYALEYSMLNGLKYVQNYGQDYEHGVMEPIKMFREDEVQLLALQIHGGRVGLQTALQHAKRKRGAYIDQFKRVSDTEA